MGGGYLVAALGPLLVLRGRSGSDTLQALGVASSVGMTLAGVTLLGLVRRDWGLAAVRPVGRAVAVGAGAALAAAGAGRILTRVWSSTGVAAAAAQAVGAALVVTAVFGGVTWALARDLVPVRRTSGENA